MSVFRVSVSVFRDSRKIPKVIEIEAIKSFKDLIQYITPNIGCKPDYHTTGNLDFKLVTKLVVKQVRSPYGRLLNRNNLLIFWECLLLLKDDVVKEKATKRVLLKIR